MPFSDISGADCRRAYTSPDFLLLIPISIAQAAERNCKNRREIILKTGYDSFQDNAMSELALKLIAENIKTRSPFLDLGNCGLIEVPQEIGELVWLEELSFASEWTYFDSKEWVTKKSQNNGPKNNMARLAPAKIWSRKFEIEKPAISSPFSGLINQTKQYLDWVIKKCQNRGPKNNMVGVATATSWNRESKIGRPATSSPFTSLIILKKLFLNGSVPSTISFNDLSPLSDLVNLQLLDISDTQVTDLSPLSNLVNLQVLNISITKVTDLSPLSFLTNLLGGCPRMPLKC